MARPHRKPQNHIDQLYTRSAYTIAELEAILNTLAEPVVVYNADGTVRKVNRATVDVYGFDPTGIVSVELARISRVHYLEGGDVPIDRLPSNRALRGERIMRERLAFSSTTGANFVVEVSAAPLLLRGKIVGAVATWHDVTEQERAEQALKASEGRYRRIVETAYEGVWTIDADTITTFVNDRMAELLGYTADEMKGKPLIDFVDEEAKEATLARLERRRRGIAEAYELKFRRKDGSSMWAIVSANPLYDIDGDFAGALAMITDVTERKRAEQLSDALNHINTVINSTLDFNQIMRKIVVDSTKGIGSEGGFVLLREGDRWVISYAHGFPSAVIGTRLTDDEAKHAALAVALREPIRVNDTATDKRVNRELMARFGVRSLLTVPLLTRRDAIGSLCFCNHSRQVSFTDAEVDFAKKLATSLSLALENARLYSAERRIADTLQEALITMPHAIEGVDFGHLYRSASETTRVGGDFYDLFTIQHGKIGVLIGDISGKGIEAATLTALVKNTIRAYALEGYSPAAVMSRTNNVVLGATPSSIFVTVFFGILDIHSGRLIYCSAGHPPALLKRMGSGDVEALLTSSPIIGAFPDLAYTDDEVVLAGDDILTLYTDGLVDARCDGSFLGEERLANIVRDLEPTPVGDVPYALVNSVTGCARGKFADDVAVLALSLRQP